MYDLSTVWFTKMDAIPAYASLAGSIPEDLTLLCLLQIQPSTYPSTSKMELRIHPIQISGVTVRSSMPLISLFYRSPKYYCAAPKRMVCLMRLFLRFSHAFRIQSIFYVGPSSTPKPSTETLHHQPLFSLPHNKKQTNKSYTRLPKRQQHSLTHSFTHSLLLTPLASPT